MHKIRNIDLYLDKFRIKFKMQNQYISETMTSQEKYLVSR